MFKWVKMYAYFPTHTSLFFQKSNATILHIPSISFQIFSPFRFRFDAYFLHMETISVDFAKSNQPTLIITYLPTFASMKWNYVGERFYVRLRDKTKLQRRLQAEKKLFFQP